MCIRDSDGLAAVREHRPDLVIADGGADAALDLVRHLRNACLLYTSDAADERSSVDLGGRRIIKKKSTKHYAVPRHMQTSKV